MKQFKLIIATMLLMAGFTNYSHAKSEWIDITEERLVNPGFDGNSNKGWTFVGSVEKYWGCFFCFLVFCIFAL